MSGALRQLVVRFVFQGDTKPLARVNDQLKSVKGHATGAGGALSSFADRLRAAAPQTSKLATNLRSLAAAYIGFSAIRSTVQAGAEFEKSMNRVGALTQTTGVQFQALENTAVELGRTTEFSASQAAEAMGFLSLAGFKADQIIGAMPNTLNLAAAAQIDLGTAADITSNILSGYGMQVSELGAANDILVAAFTSSNTDLRMLGESFKYVGPIAKAAGVEFAEAAAAIGFMGDAGIQASMAGTGLRGIIANLLSPTKQQSKIMARLGLSAKDTAGNLLPLRSIVDQLAKSGITTGEVLQLFGDRAGPAMQVLIERGSKALDEQTKRLKDQGGIAQRIADRQMQGYTGAVKRMTSALEGLQIALDRFVLPVLAKMADFITALSQDITAILSGTDKLTGRQKALAWVIGAVVAIGGTLLALKLPALFALIGLGGVKAITAIGVAFKAIFSPIGLVTTLILGVILVIEDLYTHLRGGQSMFAQYWEPFIRKIDEVRNNIAAIPGFFEAAWSSAKAIVDNAITDMVNAIMRLPSTIASAFPSISGLLGRIGGALGISVSPGASAGARAQQISNSTSSQTINYQGGPISVTTNNPAAAAGAVQAGRRMPQLRPAGGMAG